MNEREERRVGETLTGTRLRRVVLPGPVLAGPRRDDSVHRRDDLGHAVTRDEIVVIAKAIHDEHGCRCDQKYIMSCARMASAVLEASDRVTELRLVIVWNPREDRPYYRSDERVEVLRRWFEQALDDRDDCPDIWKIEKEERVMKIPPGGLCGEILVSGESE